MIEIKKEAFEKIGKYNLEEKKLVEFIKKKVNLKKREFAEKYSDEKTWSNYILIGKISNEGLITLEDIGKLLSRVSKDVKIYAMDDSPGNVSVRDYYKKEKG